ncbi:MAG: hypothetical protein CMM05_00185 [Rhodopirellula sp.]|nr:hypothetical protein [Rhodopirellula sp.]
MGTAIMASVGFRVQRAARSVRKGLNHRIVMMPLIGIGHSRREAWADCPMPEANSVLVASCTVSSRMTFRCT